MHNLEGNMHQFIIRLFIPAVLIGGIAQYTVAETGTSSSTTRNGVTFTFTYNCNGGPCTRGRFVNGEPWVIPATSGGAVTITAISPSGTANGAMVNPQLVKSGSDWAESQHQGLLPMYGHYSASLNIMTQLPYQARAGESILKIKSQTSGCGTSAISAGCVSTGEVLTVLGSVPENDGATVFRPPFHGDWKPLFTTDKVRMERLPSLVYSTGIPTNFEHWLAPQYELNHNNYFSGEFHRATIPHSAQTPYAADQAKKFQEDLLALFGSAAESQKRPGVYTLMQKGIDNYGVFKMGVLFSSGAGQHLGKKPPLAFFAAMYDDPALLDEVRAIATNEEYQNGSYFQEDSQIRMGNGGMPVWGERNGSFDSVHWYFSRLYPRLDGNGATGDPYGWIDGPAGGVYPDESATRDRNYLPVSGGGHIGYAFLQHLMPWYEYAAGDPEILAWSDRMYDGYGIDNFDGGMWTRPDPCAPVDPVDMGCAPYKLYSTGDTGCKRYMVTWGPQETNPGECIKHNGSDMTDGRMPALHGYKYEFSRLPVFVKAAWKTLRPCSDPANPAYPCAGLGPEPGMSGLDMLAFTDVPVTAPLTVSPNPSTGFVSIQGPSVTYNVYDHAGRLVKTINRLGVLDEGVYVVATPDGSAMAKVIVTD